MVLAELGTRLTNALKNMRNAPVIDKATLDKLLKEIGDALLSADVNQRLVIRLKVNIARAVNAHNSATGINKRSLIERTCVQELGKLLEPGKKPFQPKRNESNVIMFVGLQGSGKTTSVTKMAYWYKRKGWSTAIVCADTFRAGAFDQIKQNATKAGVPFYGSYTECDPVVVAVEGIERFRSDNTEIILLDTSGRHKQEAALFEEMEAISTSVDPDDTVFVVDSTIGQAAKDQANAFSQSVNVGSVILTKLDGHAKGGGALSAVAATQSPISFIGTGEHIDKFERFNTTSFVSRLLGKWDVAGIVSLYNESKSKEINEPEIMNRLMEGKFSLRDMRDQLQTVLNMGPGIMSMIPGLSQLTPKGSEDASRLRIKEFMTLMDAMTNQELDGEPKLFNYSRMYRIAHGSGLPVQSVQDLLNAFKPFKKMGGNLGKVANRAGGGDLNNLTPRQLAQALDPRTLKSLGGQGGLQNMMKQMKDMNGDTTKMDEMMRNLNLGGMGGVAAGMGKRGRRRR